MSKVIDKKMRRTLEDQLFIIGLVFLFILTVVGVILIKYESVISKVQTCALYTATGYYCPGCGGTRAFISFAKGNIIKSFLYHPVVPYAMIIYIVFMVSHSIEKIERLYYRRKNRNDGRYLIKGLKFRDWYLYGALAIIAVNFVLRNVMIFAGRN